MTLQSLIDTSGQRTHALVRNSFVRGEEGQESPLARLASRGGRGGTAVAIKLYLVLLWRCAKDPFETAVPARTWASLLDLPEPARLGARRVKDAMRILTELRLINVELRRGAPSNVTLLREDGSGRPYSLPYDSYRLARNDAKAPHAYFKVPVTLWTSGHMQGMSAAATVMLLILLEETRSSGGEQWWSISTFASRFAVSKDVRARGTKELVARGLLVVTRMNLPPVPGVTTAFGQELVRNKYRLIGAALAADRGSDA